VHDRMPSRNYTRRVYAAQVEGAAQSGDPTKFKPVPSRARVCMSGLSAVVVVARETPAARCTLFPVFRFHRSDRDERWIRIAVPKDGLILGT
jgi:hypothetical protein